MHCKANGALALSSLQMYSQTALSKMGVPETDFPHFVTCANTHDSHRSCVTAMRLCLPICIQTERFVT